MDWYYSIGTTQNGPVTEEEIRRLASTGTISGDNLVWNDTMADWQPLHSTALFASVFASSSPAAPALPTTQSCTECGQSFPSQQLVTIHGASVCLRCKDTALQKLRQGVILGGIAWSEGKRLVIADNTSLPNLCVKCGCDAHDSRVKRKFYWHPPILALLILLNLLIFAIVALCVRKKLVADIGVCSACKSTRVKHLIIAWLLLLGGIAMGVAGAINEQTWGFICIPLVIISLLWFVLKTQLLRPTKIKDGYGWFVGAHPDFLKTLPPWQGLR